MTPIETAAAILTITAHISKGVVWIHGTLSKAERRALVQVTQTAIMEASPDAGRAASRKMADVFVAELQDSTRTNISEGALRARIDEHLKPVDIDLDQVERMDGLSLRKIHVFARSLEQGMVVAGEEFTNHPADEDRFWRSNAEALASTLELGLATWDQLYQLTIYSLTLAPPYEGKDVWYEVVPWALDKRSAFVTRWEWSGIVANRIARGMQLNAHLVPLVDRLERAARVHRQHFSTLALADFVYTARRVAKGVGRMGYAVVGVLAALILAFALDAADVVDTTRALSVILNEIGD